MLLLDLWSDARELAQEAYGDRSPIHIFKAVLTLDSYQITALQRLRDAARRWHIPVLNHTLRVVQTVVHGIELGKDTTLGHGIYFVHPFGTVIGGTARVGDRVRFFGNNTVGTADENGCPVIEDDVWVGAGARVLGPILGGRGARIGANAVVLHDVPPGAIAVGVPARNATRGRSRSSKKKTRPGQ